MNANPRSMTIRHPGNAQPSPSGTASKPFWAEMLLEGGDGEMTAMRAHFDPGAISHWHSHPRGQFLYVLSGLGRAQRDGGKVETLRSGDAIWFAPGEKHWHGAAEDSPFSYLSIQPREDGRFVDWMEAVKG